MEVICLLSLTGMARLQSRANIGLTAKVAQTNELFAGFELKTRKAPAKLGLFSFCFNCTDLEELIGHGYLFWYEPVSWLVGLTCVFWAENANVLSRFISPCVIADGKAAVWSPAAREDFEDGNAMFESVP